MKKIMLIYGVISGAIITGSLIAGLVFANAEKSMQSMEWVGYLIMMVALSIIFVGIKRYRDQELGGIIKFGTAFLLGLGISVVASVIYVIAWEINLSVTDYTFIEDYTTSIIHAREAEGMSRAELDNVVEEMETLKTRYANPVYRIPITFSEILPVGLLISLIAAGVLRNSNVLPATA